MITKAFAAVLKANREEFNQRYLYARKRFPNIDKKTFLEFLENSVVPIVESVDNFQSERVSDVVSAAYDIGLELVGQHLIDYSGKSEGINRLWQNLFPSVAHLVVQNPRKIFTAFSNAFYHLLHTAEARPVFWINEMLRLSSKCSDVDTFLEVGQIVAWRSGLAHLREGALTLAANLPQGLAIAAVGGPVTADWQKLLSQIRADPWFDPSEPEKGPVFGVVARVGGFRGFGGPFVSPPQVSSDGKNFWVRSSDEYWQLTADCFGTTVHHADAKEFDNAAKRNVLPTAIQISGTTVQYKDHIAKLENIGDISSAACNGRTLALTFSQTHMIVLLPLRS